MDGLSTIKPVQDKITEIKDQMMEGFVLPVQHQILDMGHLPLEVKIQMEIELLFAVMTPSMEFLRAEHLLALMVLTIQNKCYFNEFTSKMETACLIKTPGPAV